MKTKQPMKYLDLLKQEGTAEHQEQLFIDQAEEASLQLQWDILATSIALRNSKEEFRKAKATSPFNSPLIIDKMSEVEGLEDVLTKLKQLKDELF